MCLVSNCGLLEAYVDRHIKCSQKFWVSPFPIHNFILLTSVTPVFKSWANWDELLKKGEIHDQNLFPDSV